MNYFTNHPICEIFRNVWLRKKAMYQYHNYNNEIRQVFPPSNYETVMEEIFTTSLNLDNWNLAQPWGEYHPDNLHQYYGIENEFAIVNENGLNLAILNKPKTFITSDNTEITIPIGIGLIHSVKNWQYGWFESWIQLPEGQFYWPAFWLTGTNSWPPEIDILEAYSNYGKTYEDYLLFNSLFKRHNWKLQLNLHYGKVEDGTKEMYGAYNVPIAECTRRFIQYVCHWEKDYIKIYYDGSLVFECTDLDVLKWYNGSNDYMNIILNHGVHNDCPGKVNEVPLVIKSVKVMQIKN